jgi:HSP20 family protein
MVIWRRRPASAADFEDRTDSGPDVEWLPDLDICESPDAFLLVLSIPGVREDDLDVFVSDRTLSISGRRVLVVPRGAVAHLLEAPRGRFARKVCLPRNADPAGLRLELRDGQLLMTVPKVVTGA